MSSHVFGVRCILSFFTFVLFQFFFHVNYFRYLNDIILKVQSSKALAIVLINLMLKSVIFFSTWGDDENKK